MSEAASDADLVKASKLPTRLPDLSSFSSGVTCSQMCCLVLGCRDCALHIVPFVPCRYDIDCDDHVVREGQKVPESSLSISCNEHKVKCWVDGWQLL